MKVYLKINPGQPHPLKSTDQFVKVFFVKFIICKNFYPGKFLAVMCIIIKVITILVALKIQVPPIFDITPQILSKCKLSIEECGQ